MSSKREHVMKAHTLLQPLLHLRVPFILLSCLGLAVPVFAGDGNPSSGQQPGFTFDCGNTQESPCRQLSAQHEGKAVLIESSSAAWSDRYRKVIVVSDNFNDLAEGEGINVEALSATSDGNLLIGFRGPLTDEGGVLALEIALPQAADDEPVLVKKHVLPPLYFPHIPKGAARSLRAISMIPGEPGGYYILLGPKGYEKEELVLVRWNFSDGTAEQSDAAAQGLRSGRRHRHTGRPGVGRR